MNKPRLSFWQIWNMSFGFLGIQFGWGLQLANMSPIYKYLHAEESSLPYLWLAGPITGLIIQPIIGSMSDRTWNRLGRRRPYFLAGAILASIALFFMPDSSAVWMAAGLLWILDASINITMEPFRAFVADKLPEEQRTLGFVMQSFFIGIGQTLRINGRAEIVIDPELNASFAVNGKLPKCVLVVTADRVYTQCPKALVRSHLWDPSHHRDPSELPTPGQMHAEIIGESFDATEYDAAYPKRIRETIY